MNQLLHKNTKVAYSDIGEGNAVVLLHGFLENKTMWQDLVPEWSKNKRIITIDLLGHGQTDCMGNVHTMEDNANIVAEVLSFLSIHKAIVVGHSMGGYVALAFAEMYPSYLQGLVLLNSTAQADSEERKVNRDKAVVAVKKDFTTFIRLSISNLFSPENRELLENEIEKVKIEALETPLQGIVASLLGMKIRKDREFLLHLNDYPKMLVLGIQDTVLFYESTAAQIANTAVELVTLDGGHMSHLENADLLKGVLVDFFKKVF